MANISLKSLLKAMEKAEARWNEAEAGMRPLPYEDLVGLKPGDKITVSCIGAGCCRTEPLSATVLMVQPNGWTERALTWGRGASLYSDLRAASYEGLKQADLRRVYSVRVALQVGGEIAIMAGLGTPIAHRGWGVVVE